MKTMKWMLAASLLFLVITVWGLYFYLNSLEDRKHLQEELRSLKGAAHFDTKTVLADKSMNQTIQSFCKALYSGADHTALRAYVTERGEAEIIPLGENKGTTKTDIKVHSISIFEGETNERTATVIAAVNRTVTIKGNSITSTHYIQLVLQKQDTWRIDSAALLTDVPAAK